MLAFVTALPCEAKPLIARFELSRISSPFPLYRNKNIFLIVSGVGKIAAAIATTFLQTIVSSPTAYLNIGIAGHVTLPVGTAVMASQIIDSSTSYRFYPTFLQRPSCALYSLCSVDKPVTTFLDSYVYDMESSGFAQAASKFSFSELIHCYKVISDNTITPITFDPKKAEDLITMHLEEIRSITHMLLEDLQALPSIESPCLTPWTNKVHFTETQKHQLKRLLERFSTVKSSLDEEDYSSCKNAKQILEKLEATIVSLTPRF